VAQTLVSRSKQPRMVQGRVGKKPRKSSQMP
jgi:hypothetical protein